MTKLRAYTGNEHFVRNVRIMLAKHSGQACDEPARAVLEVTRSDARR
jgi:hypothetical protein